MIKTILVRLLSHAGMIGARHQDIGVRHQDIGARHQDIHKNKEFNCG